MKDVGFTGIRTGMTPLQSKAIAGILYSLKGSGLLADNRFHYGDCVGSDSEAFRLAKAEGFFTISHPPKLGGNRAYTLPDEEREPKDFLVRNHDIVDESSVLVSAVRTFEEELRSGTWATIRYAVKCGIPIALVNQDGEVERRNE